MNFRSPELLRAIAQLPCTLRLPGCLGGPSVACHSNWSTEGKGKSIKAHDCHACAGCTHCHYELDQGKNLSRAQRREVWVRAFLLTWLFLLERGLVVVAGASARRVAPPARLDKVVSREPPPWRRLDAVGGTGCKATVETSE